MREKSMFRTSISQNMLRQELLNAKIELSSKNSSGETSSLTFFSLDEANAYFYDVYRRHWSSLDNTSYDELVSSGDLSWIPDSINSDTLVDFTMDDVSADICEDMDDDYSDENLQSETNTCKDRIKSATRRRNHWAKDQLHPAEVCAIMTKKAYKEIRDSKHPSKDEKDTRGPIQKKFDAFFKVHVHAISRPDISIVGTKNSGNISASCEVANSHSTTKKHTKTRSGISSRGSIGITVRRRMKVSKNSLISGKYDYKKYTPIILEHGYGFGLLYRHIHI